MSRPAIIVTGSTAEVIGKTKVGFFDYSSTPEGEKDYVEVAAGEKYDLKTRKKIEPKKDEPKKDAK